MSDDSDRWHITFNGEIYNYASLRKDLLASGCRFRGQSDTEVLVQGFAFWGFEATMARCNGMWALAAYDSRSGRLYFSRDRFGEKPLYLYRPNGHTLLFASELKALFEDPFWCGTLNHGALAHFLDRSYIGAPPTVFSQVRQLPPGHHAQWDGRNLKEVSYWSAYEVLDREEETHEPLSYWRERLESSLTQSVVQRTVADVPLGCFLSGGIDSSLMAALLQKGRSKPLKTYAIGFTSAEFDESSYAERVARHLGTDHTTLMADEAALLDLVPRLSNVYDEPFADSSQLPTLLVTRLARNHVTVALSGDGGDELFGGYHRHIQAQGSLKTLQRLPLVLRQALGRMLGLLPRRTYDALNRWVPEKKRLSLFGEKIHKLARLLQVQAGPQWYGALIQQGPFPDVLKDDFATEASIPEFPWQAQWSLMRNMMLHDVVGYLCGDLLTKVDRSAMAWSLETRVPFLDPEVFSLASGLPERFKVHQGQGKWLLRQILYRYVPQELLDRPKAGFAIPLNAWLRGPLKDWVQDTLFSQSALNVLDEGKTRNLLAKFHKGAGSPYTLWNVLILAQWLQTHHHRLSLR
jgi:asparagine synthase (glutamine-hydrolysing)